MTKTIKIKCWEFSVWTINTGEITVGVKFWAPDRNLIQLHVYLGKSSFGIGAINRWT